MYNGCSSRRRGRGRRMGRRKRWRREEVSDGWVSDTCCVHTSPLFIHTASCRVITMLRFYGREHPLSPHAPLHLCVQRGCSNNSQLSPSPLHSHNPLSPIHVLLSSSEAASPNGQSCLSLPLCSSQAAQLPCAWGHSRRMAECAAGTCVFVYGGQHKKKHSTIQYL